jgi:hypothetical protein
MLKWVLVVFSFLSLLSVANSAPLRVHPKNPRYFCDVNGVAFYLAGVDNFRALQDWDAKGVGPFDYQGFLNYLKRYNHNFLRMWTWEHTFEKDGGNCVDRSGKSFYISPPHVWKRTGPGMAIDGLKKFDLTGFDQAYFDRLRDRVVEAGKGGIYVAYVFFQGFSVDRSAWCGHPFNSKNNINGIDGDDNDDGDGFETHTLHNPKITNLQKAYIKKVIDTLWDQNNVLFEVANEPLAEKGQINSVDAVKNWNYHLINFIHAYEQSTYGRQHPVGMSYFRTDGDPSSINGFLFSSPAEYISPGGRWVEPAWQNNPPLSTGSKVVIADTDHIHPDQQGGPGYHPWLWMCLTRGHNVNAVDGDGEVEDWFSEVDSRVMADTSKYAGKMDLSSAIPTDSPRDCSTTYCLKNIGKEYLIYQPLPGLFTVNLIPGSYQYEWFNPQTGKVHRAGSIFSSGGNQRFIPPFSGQAVLYLKKRQE